MVQSAVRPKRKQLEHSLAGACEHHGALVMRHRRRWWKAEGLERVRLQAGQRRGGRGQQRAQ